MFFVIFIYIISSRAKYLGLTGWVRNLPDGRVEAVFEGPEEYGDVILKWCHQALLLLQSQM